MSRTKRLGIVLALVGASSLLVLTAISTLLNEAQYEGVSRWSEALAIGFPVLILGVVILILSWVVEGFVSPDQPTPKRTFLLK